VGAIRYWGGDVIAYVLALRGPGGYESLGHADTTAYGKFVPKEKPTRPPYSCEQRPFL